MLTRMALYPRVTLGRPPTLTKKYYSYLFYRDKMNEYSGFHKKRGCADWWYKKKLVRLISKDDN